MNQSLPVAEQATTVICGYCHQVAELADSGEMYGGHSYGPIYLCRPCDAWVGCHPNTLQPLGTLANEELRKWRSNAHAGFDVLWRSGRMKREEAYEWLAGRLGVDRDECHIGMFNIKQCKQVVQLCIKEQVGQA